MPITIKNQAEKSGQRTPFLGKGLLFPAVLVALLLVSGCSRYKMEAREEQTTNRIDAYLSEGMSEADMKKAFPGAQLWNEDGNVTRYVVAVNKVCFWCWSHTGFSKSSEDFARVVRFENGRLTKIEPVELRY